MSASSTKKKNLAKKVGWMEKKGDKGPVKIWRQRYFVETEKGTIQYFTSTDLTQETYRGQIDLHDVLSVSKSIEVDVTQAEQNKLEFNVLVKSGRIYRLRAGTQEERKQWMTVFGSKLLRAREQQQRPLPPTNPTIDPKQDFNNFDFHAHTMPAYVMKQLYEESQQPDKHPGTKLERSHSAENPRQVAATPLAPNSPYGKLSAAPIIVDLTNPNTARPSQQPHSYGLMPKPETLRAMKSQQHMSSMKDGYLHLIQHEPEKYLHVTNPQHATPPTAYARLSKYNLESSTNYEQTPHNMDFSRPSGMAMSSEKELERLEKLLMEEEYRGSIYGKPQRSFMQEEEPFDSPPQKQPEAATRKPTYHYGSISSVAARMEELEQQQNNNGHASNSPPPGVLKSNRRSSLDMYQAIPNNLPPNNLPAPQTPVALAEEKASLRGSLDTHHHHPDKKGAEPEYGCLPAIRKSQISPEIAAMLENNKHAPPSSPTRSPSKPPPKENKVVTSDTEMVFPQTKVEATYLQMPCYDAVKNPTQEVKN